MQPEASGHYVQSLARGLAVIKSFGEQTPELTLSQIAKSTGLTRATARRFLLTLVELGYVRSDGRLFMLNPRVLELGYSYLSGLSLPDAVQPHLEALSRELDESTSASVFDGEEVVYIARAATRRIMSVGMAVGTRVPAYATAMGRVLLAGLPAERFASYVDRLQATAFASHALTDPVGLRAAVERVRDQGWSVVDEELECGLRSVAAPLRQNGRVVAAVNVSTASVASSLAVIHDVFLPALLETARRIDDEIALVKDLVQL